MAKGSKGGKSKKEQRPKKDARIAEEEEALARLETEAAELRQKIAFEEAQKSELLEGLKAVQDEWLFDKQQLYKTQAELSKARENIASQLSLHATLKRIEKDRLAKLRLNEASEAVDLLLHSQAALVLREREQLSHIAEAAAVADDFRAESLELQASKHFLLGAIRMEYDEKLLKVREAAEQAEANILLKHKVKTNQLRETREKALTRTITALEEQKAQQIADQQAESKKQSQNTKRFFSDVTAASLSLIRQLKEEQEELKHVEARSTKTLAELHTINRGIAEPLKGLREETDQLQHSLQVYTSELQQIATAKEACRKQEKLYQALKLQQEVLTQQLLMLQKEKQTLAEKLRSESLKIQQRRTLESMILEKKIACLTQATEVADAQAAELKWVSSTELDGRVPFSEQLTGTLGKKQNEQQCLREEIQNVQQLHAEVFDSFMAALHATGFTTDDLGIELKPRLAPQRQFAAATSTSK